MRIDHVCDKSTKYNIQYTNPYANTVGGKCVKTFGEPSAANVWAESKLLKVFVGAYLTSKRALEFGFIACGAALNGKGTRRFESRKSRAKAANFVWETAKLENI